MSLSMCSSCVSWRPDGSRAGELSCRSDRDMVAFVLSGKPKELMYMINFIELKRQEGKPWIWCREKARR
jgi:hypothetical protein